MVLIKSYWVSPEGKQAIPENSMDHISVYYNWEFHTFHVTVK